MRRIMVKFIPSYYIMVSVIAALLRVKETQDANETFAPWVPVLDRLVWRTCDHSGYGCNWNGAGCSIASHDNYWEATAELKVLVDKGYATVNRETAHVTPTPAFDILTTWVMDETQMGLTSGVVGNLGWEDTEVIDPETQKTQLEVWEFEHTFFEADDSPEGFRLRSKILEQYSCPLCHNYYCGGPQDCD